MSENESDTDGIETMARKLNIDNKYKNKGNERRNETVNDNGQNDELGELEKKFQLLDNK